jgi:hypothetical protein
LSWTYYPVNGSIDIAFRATPVATVGWVVRGINPTATTMVGTHALIAFRNTNGSAVVYTYNLMSQSPPSPSNISITVSDKSVVYESAGHITIFSKLTLPSNKTVVNMCGKWEVQLTTWFLKPMPLVQPI